jgi:glutathione S-transferase
LIYEGAKIVEEKNKNAVIEMLKFLNDRLEGRKFIAGDNLTIADFSLLTSITSFEVSSQVSTQTFSKLYHHQEIVGLLSNYSNLNKWYLSLQSLPKFDENLAGAKMLADLVKGIVGGPLF